MKFKKKAYIFPKSSLSIHLSTLAPFPSPPWKFLLPILPMTSMLSNLCPSSDVFYSDSAWNAGLCWLRDHSPPPLSFITMPLHSLLLFPLYLTPNISFSGFNPRFTSCSFPSLHFHLQFLVKSKDFSIGFNQALEPLCLPVYWLEYERKLGLCVTRGRNQCVVSSIHQ